MPKYSIPLAGPYTSRISAVNASDSTSGFVGIGIVGLMVVGQTTQATEKDRVIVDAKIEEELNEFEGEEKKTFA